MSRISSAENNPKLQALICLFAFCLPLSVGLNNVILCFLLGLFLFFAPYRLRVFASLNIPLMRPVLVIILLHVLGLTHTSDLSEGRHQLLVHLKLLGIPFLAALIAKENRRQVLWFFVGGVITAHFFSQGLILGFLNQADSILPAVKVGLGGSPFISRVPYSVLLCFAILSLFYLLWEKRKRQMLIFGFLLVLLSMLSNLIWTEGRTGQILLAVLVLVSTAHFFRSFRLTGLVFGLLVGLGFFLYQHSDSFRKRVGDTILQMHNYESGISSGWGGDRLIMWQNSLLLFARQPLFGYGSGSFHKEYTIINSQLTPQHPSMEHPHNQFLFFAVQFGLPGLLVLCWLFWEIAIQTRNNQNLPLAYPRVLLCFGFPLVCMVDTLLTALPTQTFFMLYLALCFSHESVPEPSPVPQTAST